MGFFNPLSLVKVFDIPASAGTAGNYISTNKPTGFTVEKVSNAEFVFFADISLGTLIRNGIRPGPTSNWIQTRVILTNISKNKCVVTLKTKLRLELILTLAAWIVFVLYFMMAKPELPLWIGTIFFPVLLLFQFFLYRVQENALQAKAERYLKAFSGIPLKNK